MSARRPPPLAAPPISGAARTIRPVDKAESRANWFAQSRRLDGPEKKCLSCHKPFRNGPGEDYRLCKEHRRHGEGIGGSSHHSSGRISAKRVSV